MRFYNERWEFIGTKIEHIIGISNLTGIDCYALGGGDLGRLTIARRLSWVAHWQTTISEDMAYCLLGIFGMNMPLLYGEGDNAFIRLQEEIMKVSDDQSIFAWKGAGSTDYWPGFYGDLWAIHGLLASSPARTSGVVAQFHSEQ